MKKAVLLFLCLFMSLAPVMAKSVKVEALEDFSTQNPPKTWQVKIVEGFVTKEGVQVYADSVVTGKIEGVQDPKRLKRNATFNFIPTEYYDSHSGISQKVEQDLVGKYSSRSDISVGSVVKTGAVTAGSHFISGFIGPGVALVEGAVKNEEGNRAKSAVVSVYESTPLSYINKGKDLEIKKGQVFVMSFKFRGEDEEDKNEPNYHYTVE